MQTRTWLLASAVFLIGIAFALYTGHAWEDWYITYRASKNLALGNGLVFTVGERVHSFTSPLGTLVPAALSFVTANRSDSLVLWLFRVIGCSFLALSAVMLQRIARATAMPPYATFLMIGLFAVDARIIDFSINGMETAFMVIFLVLSLYLLCVPVRRIALKLGLAWAGLMWTRPDSFIYIGGLAMGCLLFKPESPNFGTRRETARTLGSAVVVAAVVYAPWVFWTWWYYGSPIPHTIIAKGLFQPILFRGLVAKTCAFPMLTVFGQSSVIDTFMPPYYIFNGWPEWLVFSGKLAGLLCTWYWCVPGGRPLGRAVSFALCVAHVYLSVVVIDVAPWYVPAVTLLSIVVLGQIAWHMMEFVERKTVSADGGKMKTVRTVLYACGMALLLASFLMTLSVGYQVKWQQEVIEDGHRHNIGLWLREHAASGKDRVFLECLGYIGFYSQLKMLDFPGLSSPEVVEARRRLNTNDYGELINDLRPDWLVLRPVEIKKIQEQMPMLLVDHYREEKVFDVGEKVASCTYGPIRRSLDFDKTFIVYRLKRG
jgi:hypothetical protein